MKASQPIFSSPQLFSPLLLFFGFLEEDYSQAVCLGKKAPIAQSQVVYHNQSEVRHNPLSSCCQHRRFSTDFGFDHYISPALVTKERKITTFQT